MAYTGSQATAVLTGLLYRAGATGLSGPATNYEAQIGYGDRGSAPGSRWVWFPLFYSGALQSNDVHTGTVWVTRSGELDLAVRFRKGIGPWVCGDLDGSSNGYSSAQAIRLSATCPPPQGGLLYRQPFAPPASGYYSSYLSPSVATNLVAADDFVMTNGSLVQTVRWTGYYPTGRAGNETGFWLRIYADDPAGFSHPGALLREEFHPGYACEFTTNILWHYQADLAAPLFVDPGTTYWFSAQMECTNVWGVVNSPAAVQGMPSEQRSGANPWGTNTLGMGFELYGIDLVADSVGDGIPDWWRAWHFGGDGRTTNGESCATADPDGDGMNNWREYFSDTDPTNAASRLEILSLGISGSAVNLTWVGGTGAWQYLECAQSAASAEWTAVHTNVPPTPVSNSASHAGGAVSNGGFYRVKAWR